MFVFGFVVLFVGLQVISAQPPPHENLPPQCRGPPPGVERPHECCKIPPFFEPKDFEECGFKKPQEGESYQRPPGPPGPRGPPGPPDCSRQQCLMDKYGLSKDGEIDYEAVSAYMDQYAEKNEAFKPAIDVAKERCVGKDLPGPPHICEGNKLVGCLSSTIFLECPAWDESDNCKTLKDHLEQCKPFFHKS